MPTPQKEAIVAEITEQLNKAKSIFLTDFKGLNVDEINNLRRELTSASVQYRVVKNSLARLSVKAAGCDELLEYLDGPTAIAFGMDDPAAPVRIIKKFDKGSDKISVKVGLMDGVLIDSTRVNEIASLLSRVQLLGQLSGVLNAPLSNLVLSLNAILSKLVFALNAVKENKDES